MRRLIAPGLAVDPKRVSCRGREDELATAVSGLPVPGVPFDQAVRLAAAHHLADDPRDVALAGRFAFRVVPSSALAGRTA